MTLVSLASIAISEDDRRFIRRAIHDLVPEARILAFGSRVHGEPRNDSDLDISIDNVTAMPLSILAALDDLFVDSGLPFTIDIVDWQRIDEDFREHILLRYVVL